MKLFEMKNWKLTFSEELWALSPFKKILDRDKSSEKVKAIAEVSYIYFFCDIKSDYILMNEEDRLEELKKDINGLSAKWKPDKVIQQGIDLYLSKETVIERLYRQSLKSALAIGDYLENTKLLLDERDGQGKPVYDIGKITIAVQKVPKLMQDLKAAYKEVVKEQQDNIGKKKGSRSFNLFEDGV